MYNVGDVVNVTVPSSPGENCASWIRGPIKETIALGNGHAVHVVFARDFRWDDGKWQAHTGVDEIIARETEGIDDLEWIDTWPRSQSAHNYFGETCHV